MALDTSQLNRGGNVNPGRVSNPFQSAGSPVVPDLSGLFRDRKQGNIFSTVAQALTLRREVERQERADKLEENRASIETLKMQRQALKEQQDLQVDLAKAGLRMDESGQLVRDESLMSETDKFLNQGKLADAAQKIAQVGGAVPGVGGGRTVGQFMAGGQPQTAGEATDTGSQPAQSDLFAEKTNVFGTPKELLSESGMERKAKINAEMKSLEKQAEKASDAKATAKQFSDFAGQYQLALAEVLSDSDLGAEALEPTASGAMLRIYGKVKNKMGMLPETKAFRDSIQAFATPLAKTAGEDRLTNEDIVRFTNLLPDMLENPSKTTVSQMRNLILKIKSQGGDTARILETFRESGGALSQVVDAVEGFESDVKTAGKKIESSSGFKIVGVRDAK